MVPYHKVIIIIIIIIMYAIMNLNLNTFILIKYPDYRDILFSGDVYKGVYVSVFVCNIMCMQGV